MIVQVALIKGEIEIYFLLKTISVEDFPPGVSCSRVIVKILPSGESVQISLTAAVAPFGFSKARLENKCSLPSFSNLALNVVVAIGMPGISDLVSVPLRL